MHTYERGRRLDPEVLLDYLSGLGDTADRVAASLTKVGVVGDPEDCHDCALAVAVARHFGLANDDVSVGCLHVKAGDVAVGEESCRRSIFGLPGPARIMRVRELPASVRLFTSAFDAGEYPLLCRHRCPKCGHGLSLEDRKECVPSGYCPFCAAEYFDYNHEGGVWTPVISSAG